MYRLYIDESGNHSHKVGKSKLDRYLGLTGLIIDDRVFKEDIAPRIEGIRSLFYKKRGIKPPLHLTDIMSGKGHFAALKDESIKNSFDSQFISLVKDTDYAIITVVVDKVKLKEMYLSRPHPYHWSLKCMLKRYCKFLQLRDGVGDVMAEAREKRENNRLQRAFEDFYNNGSRFADPKDIQRRISRKEITFRNKEHFNQGLELADLLALSSKIDVLHAFGRIDELSDNFTNKVIAAIQNKYYTGLTEVKGNGKKFTPR